MNGLETPPPGDGFESVTEAVVPAAREAAGTVALSSVELTNVVVSALLFHDATVVGRKPVPTISIEVEGLPAGKLAGETELIVGNGFTTVNC